MADSDLEDGVEKFEVTDSDLQFGFNPGNRRKQTKNQATYGELLLSYLTCRNSFRLILFSKFMLFLYFQSGR